MSLMIHNNKENVENAAPAKSMSKEQQMKKGVDSLRKQKTKLEQEIIQKEKEIAKLSKQLATSLSLTTSSYLIEHGFSLEDGQQSSATWELTQQHNEEATFAALNECLKKNLTPFCLKFVDFRASALVRELESGFRMNESTKRLTFVSNADLLITLASSKEIEQSKIQQIDLVSINMTNELVSAIVSLTARLPALTSFSVGNSEIDKVTLRLIFKAVSSAASLRSFSFFGNKLEDDGAEILAEAVSNPSIHRIFLRNNNITDAGAEHFFSLIARLPSLDILSVQENHLSEAMVARLVKAVQTRSQF